MDRDMALLNYNIQAAGKRHAGIKNTAVNGTRHSYYVTTHAGKTYLFNCNDGMDAINFHRDPVLEPGYHPSNAMDGSMSAPNVIRPMTNRKTAMGDSQHYGGNCFMMAEAYRLQHTNLEWNAFLRWCATASETDAFFIVRRR